MGVDRPSTPQVFQGVVAPADFPNAKLDVSLDSILEQQSVMSTQQPIAQHAAVADSNAEFLDVPVDLIDPSPFQPRLDISEVELELLSNSIAVARRVNRPILIRKKQNGRFELIGGERRWRSVTALGWATIPSRIVDVDDAEAEVLALSDNEGQEGLTDYERGRTYVRILERNPGMSQRALASRVGVSHTSVARCLVLGSLPQCCLDFLDKHPALLGSKLAYEFAAFSQEHSDLLLEALIKIDQEDISQEQALRWMNQTLALRSQTQPKSTSTRVQAVRFAGGHEGAIQVGKSDIRIKIPKGVDMERIERAIIQALESTE